MCRIFAVIAIIAMVVGCTNAGDLSEEQTRVELDDKGRITYFGSLSAEANEQAAAIFDAATTKPDTVVIASGGGSIELGLDLAEWILNHDLHVEVAGGCLSSCANYIFLAGKTKRLRENSVLVWHGSAWQASFDRFTDPADPEFSRKFVELRKRESGFFERIGVDNLITVYGQGRASFVDALPSWLRGRQLLGFDYSLEDMGRMGVSGLELLDGSWSWREHRRDLAPRVFRPSLPYDYEFSLRRFAQD